jgi:hypothetical protein
LIVALPTSFSVALAIAPPGPALGLTVGAGAGAPLSRPTTSTAARVAVAGVDGVVAPRRLARAEGADDRALAGDADDGVLAWPAGDRVVVAVAAVEVVVARAAVDRAGRVAALAREAGGAVGDVEHLDVLGRVGADERPVDVEADLLDAGDVVALTGRPSLAAPSSVTG